MKKRIRKSNTRVRHSKNLAEEYTRKMRIVLEILVLVIISILLYVTGIYWDQVGKIWMSEQKQKHEIVEKKEQQKIEQSILEKLKKIQEQADSSLIKKDPIGKSPEPGPEPKVEISKPETPKKAPIIKKPDPVVKKPVIPEKKVSFTPTNKIKTRDLLGKVSPGSDPRFIRLPQKYLGYKNSVMTVRGETAVAFMKMSDAAAKDGVTLQVVSAMRTFDQQRSIWESKWNGHRSTHEGRLSREMSGLEKAKIILTYSAMPGTSRHHWGTDIDINNTRPEYFATSQGRNVYAWLQNNAHNYGFCQTYAQQNPAGEGYSIEKWHWSYMPLGKKFLDVYRQSITQENISGFPGSEYVDELDVLQKYVFSLSSKCL
jgi:LAS superfamily LD-carboxypeptidase LdcB